MTTLTRQDVAVGLRSEPQPSRELQTVMRPEVLEKKTWVLALSLPTSHGLYYFVHHLISWAFISSHAKQRVILTIRVCYLYKRGTL